eukprot:TRINITY_DN6113_c0_g1_i1.p1 TRINITY_DN6113_c0_g1~~TRINITY_DN6113_c0_g1_i1.p1  ORF type:complete len:211 (+),score=28.38 TRINITY_DN6113_c0_g1_i1:23-655(+)
MANTKEILNETFTADVGSLQWFSPPPEYKATPTGLDVHTAAKTDYWSKTHYGFIKNDGHFLFMNIDKKIDFDLHTRIDSKPVHQYDQAGLLIRYSNDCWIKTSIENEPQEPFNKLGAVVTNHSFSDWSSQNFSKESNAASLKIEKRGSDFTVFYRVKEGDHWTQMRMARLLENEKEDVTQVQVGIYCCSPIEAGCVAHFDFLRIEKVSST